jgi:hypothetical protein
MKKFEKPVLVKDILSISEYKELSKSLDMFMPIGEKHVIDLTIENLIWINSHEILPVRGIENVLKLILERWKSFIENT